jgi:hypothetical protein
MFHSTIQQQRRTAACVQQAGQRGGIEELAGHDGAAGQAQVQQARAALGVAHLERMLQHQQRERGIDRRDPAADAGSAGAQAGGAGGAAKFGRDSHGRQHNRSPLKPAEISVRLKPDKAASAVLCSS